MGVQHHHLKHGSSSGKPKADRLVLPVVLFIVVSLLACSRMFSWSAGSGHTLGPVVPSTTAATAGSNLQQSSNGQQQPQQQQPDPAWENNIIFDGRKGRLDDCPEDSSGWSHNTWAKPIGASYSGGSMLPHTSRVQQVIWEHQNPADCSKAKFLLYSHPGLKGEGSHGVGSVLHLETVMLLLALNSGRVLVEVPGTYLTDHPYCGNRTTLDSCYFQPLSHCKVTPEQITAAYTLNATAGSSDQALFLAGNEAQLDALPQFVAARKLFPQKSKLVHTVPKIFEDLMADTGIPHKNHYYWWRAQAISYIVRPNEQAIQELEARKKAKLRGQPLAPGCVSVYIRHGDKHTEHQTYEDPQYEEVLSQLLKVDPSLTRQVFLSTEDPGTVAYFTNSSRGWDTTYVDMPRKPDRKKNNVAYMREHGFAEEMLDGLLNLDLALQCDGFVGSINSNWARLIDEMRSSIRCKAHKKYMDVGIRAPKGFFFWY